MMKILQLVKKFPYPIKDGESIAVNALSKPLTQLGCEITLLTMNTTKHFFDFQKIPAELSHYHEVQAVLVDNRLKPLDAFFNLFSDTSYHVSRFVSKKFEVALQALLQKKNFDVVQLESLYLAPYIPIIRANSKAKIVMRSHNVEYEIWNRISQNTPPGFKKIYLKLLTQRLERFEIAQLQAYDLLAAISERDLKAFEAMGYAGKSLVTPIGLTMDQYLPNWKSFERPLTLSFIGSLDWPPNVEGLKWFLEQAWPQLQIEFPGLTFHIAGRATPEWLMNCNINGVRVHGEVPNAQHFINQHPVMVVPLFSGSGMRAKILEAMALGRLVVTTSIGLEGISAIHGEQVLIADTAEQFIAQIKKTHEEPLISKQLGQNARNLISGHFDSLLIAKKLLESYQN